VGFWRVTTWTEQDRDAIVALYGVESASVIGARYRISRNAVVGIWHRARQSGRLMGRDVSKISRENATKAKVVKPQSPRKPRPEAGPAPAIKLIAEARAARETEIVCEPVGLLDAKDCHCRYQIGKGRDELSLFCGAQVEAATSWCAGHARIVFQPMSKAPVSIRRAA
jgi:hypothetical protein